MVASQVIDKITRDKHGQFYWYTARDWSHLRRPRNFIFENIVLKRRLPYKQPLAVFNPTFRFHSSRSHNPPMKNPLQGRGFHWYTGRDNNISSLSRCKHLRQLLMSAPPIRAFSSLHEQTNKITHDKHGQFYWYNILVEVSKISSI